jgi:hypothetical protein
MLNNKRIYKSAVNDRKDISPVVGEAFFCYFSKKDIMFRQLEDKTSKLFLRTPTL